MRRTVFSATALACTAVLVGTVPAFADGASPRPSTRPSVSAAPASASPTTAPAPASPTATRAPSAVPSAAPTRVPSSRQVSVRPNGAPDTGVAPAATSSSGPAAGLVGGSAVAVFALGAGVFAVRRRRATGE
ncbi:sortase-dependent protein [Streptomyces sp. NPDC058122]|uniref:sortase-dependent protein n=1 Tax=Streptomyces sp. NPDC058122 TaxID=3346349 RepID=UPI0036F0D089